MTDRSFRESIKFEIADVVRQDLGFPEHAVLLFHGLAVARNIFSGRFRRVLWQNFPAVFHDKMPVTTCISHLSGQQICEDNSVLSRVVVTFLFVRQECIGRFLRNFPIELVLP